jgi:carbamoyltransferase
MMSVATATERGAAVAPACLHVDGTARLQTVARGSNPTFERLLDAFEAQTGVPVVLNTSFNGAGEPIVERPEDAIATFLAAPRLDDLFLGPYRVRRG